MKSRMMLPVLAMVALMFAISAAPADAGLFGRLGICCQPTCCEEPACCEEEVEVCEPECFDPCDPCARPRPLQKLLGLFKCKSSCCEPTCCEEPEPECCEEPVCCDPCDPCCGPKPLEKLLGLFKFRGGCCEPVCGEPTCCN